MKRLLFRQRLVWEGSHLAEKREENRVVPLLTQKIESCFKSEFKIKSVKMSVKISRKKNDVFDGWEGERKILFSRQSFFSLSERSTHRYKKRSRLMRERDWSFWKIQRFKAVGKTKFLLLMSCCSWITHPKIEGPCWRAVSEKTVYFLSDPVFTHGDLLKLISPGMMLLPN